VALGGTPLPYPMAARRLIRCFVAHLNGIFAFTPEDIARVDARTGRRHDGRVLGLSSLLFSIE